MRFARVFFSFFVFVFSLDATDFSKVDARLYASIQSGRVKTVPSRVFHVIIETDDAAALRQAGIEVGAVGHSMVTARITLPDLPAMMSMPQVKRIQMAGMATLNLDVSVGQIHADAVHRGDSGPALTGENVLVGIYDTGIDWTHADFRRSDGTTRIVELWDQTDESGDPPVQTGYNYGSVYSEDEINQELDGAISGRVQGRDTHGHGTHVAGIAAGNGRATGHSKPAGRFVGVAPDAGIIVVKGGDSQSIPDTEIMNGLDYLFQRAEALGRPMVVNLSLGHQKGPHDGSSYFEQFIDNLLDQPGRAVVVSAGNEKDDAIHARVDFNELATNDSAVVAFLVGENSPDRIDQLLFEGWMPPSVMTVTLVSPAGNRYGPVALGDRQQFPSTGTPMLIIDRSNYTFSNGDHMVSVILTDSDAGDIAQGEWRMVFHQGGGVFDIWLYDQTLVAEFTSYVDRTTLIAEPGNASRAITVGSYVSRVNWPTLVSSQWGPGGLEAGTLSSFSSPGPARENTSGSFPFNKPEITAPGEFILSAFSQWTTSPPVDQYLSDDGVHRALRGTSMSAPHVAGAVALLFEAHPDMMYYQAEADLIMSAEKEGHTQLHHDNDWGFGKLNVSALVSDVEKFEARPELFELHQNYPNPFNGITIISFQLNQPSRVAIAIFDVMGRQVSQLANEFMDAGSHHVSWSGSDEEAHTLPSGVYFCEVKTEHQTQIRKMTLIR